MKIFLSTAVAIILSETDKAFRQEEPFKCYEETTEKKRKKIKQLRYGRYE